MFRFPIVRTQQIGRGTRPESYAATQPEKRPLVATASSFMTSYVLTIPARFAEVVTGAGGGLIATFN